MTLPKFNETMYPLLKEIEDWKEYKISELSDVIINKYFNLSEDERLLRVSNWKTIFYDRLTRGRTYLKKAWLVEDPKRWYVKITNEWKNALSENTNEISLKYLENYPSYIEFKYGSSDLKSNILDSQINNDLSPEDMMEWGFEIINSELKNNLLEKLYNMNPYEFELVVLRLFEKMWYWKFKITSRSNDWGIDGIINQDELWLEKIFTQAKRYAKQNIVQETSIRNFIWAMSSDTNKGIFITTSDYSAKAHEKAKSANHKIILINGVELTRLMLKHNIWIQVSHSYEVKAIDNEFFENL